MGVPITEEEEEIEEPQPSSPSDTKPNSNMSENDDDSGFLELPRKKKIFSSSSFYEEPNAIYPTVQEQVDMCRKIADSLSDDCNKKSRGCDMFFKRVKRAEKWVVQTSAMFGDGQVLDANNTTDPATMPYVRISKEPPKLKLILDPRHMIDLKRLREEGVQIVEHNAVSKNLIQNIVNDLNSPTGKGAQLFAKRKKKSMDWVVDEDKVKEHLKEMQDRERGIFPPEPSFGFMDGRPVSSNEIAETVIRAAETKVMNYPAPRHFAIEPAQYYTEPTFYEPQPLVQNRLTNVEPAMQAIPAVKAGIYACRAPRGWTSITPSSTTSMFENMAIQPEMTSQSLPRPKSEILPQNYPALRTYSYINFNSTPKAWSSVKAPEANLQMKKIRPPSVLAQ